VILTLALSVIGAPVALFLTTSEMPYTISAVQAGFGAVELELEQADAACIAMQAAPAASKLDDRRRRPVDSAPASLRCSVRNPVLPRI
jgi:hypothetical protein